MSRTLGILLMLVGSVLAQQLPPSKPPPYTTPPTFPEGQQRMPPDTKAPPPQELSTAQVGQHIQEKLRTEPALSNTDVRVKVDDSSVILSGIVDTNRQHDLALRIAKSYAGERQIMDKIQIRQQS